VIAAPPKVLGELRREYSKKLQSKIVAEIDKDLTHHTFPEIAKILGVRGV
jgi:protein required for attachment to host cells